MKDREELQEPAQKLCEQELALHLMRIPPPLWVTLDVRVFRLQKEADYKTTRAEIVRAFALDLLQETPEENDIGERAYRLSTIENLPREDVRILINSNPNALNPFSKTRFFNSVKNTVSALLPKLLHTALDVRVGTVKSEGGGSTNISELVSYGIFKCLTMDLEGNQSVIDKYRQATLSDLPQEQGEFTKPRRGRPKKQVS